MKAPETFRCHVIVKGKQCPCELTLVNTFSFSLRTFDKRAEEKGKKLDMGMIAHNAICPWHARMFRNFRRDICKIEYVIGPWLEREKRERRAVRVQAGLEAFDKRSEQWRLARTPAMGRALLSAGVVAK